MEVTVVALYLVTLSVLAIYGAHRGHLLSTYWKHRKKHIAPVARYSEENLPNVTIQLPIFNEMYVTERLLESVVGIDYPTEKLQIQVLDDSTDETQEIAEEKVRELQARGHNVQYLHRTDRVGYKAGALEAGTKVATGDFLMVFDADFVPTAGIVRKLIHYFNDPKVAMVQARWGHLNRNHSTLTTCQSLLLDGHFVIEHIARNRSGRYFNFNGTAGIWRRAAIVDAGGWEHDTVTEDMDLSFRAQLRGWNFVYVPNAIAPAEVPCDMNAFKAQQFRWAKGSAQTTRKLLGTVLRAPIPWRIKLEAFFHLTNNFAYFFLVILAALQLPNMLLRQQMQHPELLLLDVPLFASTCGSIIVFYLVTHHALYGNIRGAFRHLPMMMALGIGLSINNTRAVLEGLFGDDVEFVRTPKHGLTDGSSAVAKLSWKTNRYRGKIPFHSIIELLFGVYFALTIAMAIVVGSWVVVPFLLLFMVGFFYVGGLSLLQELDRWRPLRALRIRREAKLAA